MDPSTSHGEELEHDLSRWWRRQHLVVQYIASSGNHRAGGEIEFEANVEMDQLDGEAGVGVMAAVSTIY